LAATVALGGKGRKGASCYPEITVLFEILNWPAATKPADNRLITVGMPTVAFRDGDQQVVVLARSKYSVSPPFCSVRKPPEEDHMRSVINSVANVTPSAISNRLVRTVMAGVDGLRASSHQLRLYTAPAPQRWAQESFAGKQKSAGTGSSLGRSELSRCTRRDTSRCRRPRVSSWLARS